ncbi:hypothetical protein LguiA_033779 [Lonicera macranthoides]
MEIRLLSMPTKSVPSTIQVQFYEKWRGLQCTSSASVCFFEFLFSETRTWCMLRGFRLHMLPYWIRPSITVSDHNGILQHSVYIRYTFFCQIICYIAHTPPSQFTLV